MVTQKEKPGLFKVVLELLASAIRQKLKNKKKKKGRRERREERKAIQIGKNIVLICKYTTAYIENLKGSTKKVK